MTVSPELQTLIDTIEAPYLMVRPDYTVAYANTAFVKRFGRYDYAGRHCYELLFHRPSRCSECGQACPLDVSSVTGEKAQTLQQVLSSNGERLYELESTPIKRADGKTVFYLERIEDRSSTKELLQSEGLVAESESVRALLKKMARVVTRDTPVLLLGKKGTGKEVFARLLHENSRRAAHSFLHLDCATLDEDVLCDELLHSVGNDLAGGTLYLSDVAELTPAMQYVVLRLLETGHVAPRGRMASQIADLRVIASTREDLGALVEAGAFREDLFYRLSVCRFEVPALAQRRADIPELARILLTKIPGGERLTLSDEAVDTLLRREWQGNAYELQATLERAVIFADGDVLGEQDVCWQPGDTVRAPARGQEAVDERSEDELLALRLKNWTGTRAELAQHLGVSVRTLYRMLRRFGLN